MGQIFFTEISYIAVTTHALWKYDEYKSKTLQVRNILFPSYEIAVANTTVTVVFKNAVEHVDSKLIYWMNCNTPANINIKT